MQKEKSLRERIKNRPVSTRPTSMKDILFFPIVKSERCASSSEGARRNATANASSAEDAGRKREGSKEREREREREREKQRQKELCHRSNDNSAYNHTRCTITFLL
jgi:hypothetical protein